MHVPYLVGAAGVVLLCPSLCAQQGVSWAQAPFLAQKEFIGWFPFLFRHIVFNHSLQTEMEKWSHCITFWYLVYQLTLFEDKIKFQLSELLLAQPQDLFLIFMSIKKKALASFTPSNSAVHTHTFFLWYKSLWWASIISSNNELSLALTDVSVWMCQQASGLTERRAQAVHHIQDLPVSTGDTWDTPVSPRNHIWRMTLDQRRKKTAMSTFDPASIWEK